MLMKCLLMNDGAGLWNQENFSEKRKFFLIFFISYFPYRMNPSSLLFNELDFYNENIVKKRREKRRNYQNNNRIQVKMICYHKHNEWRDPPLKALRWNFQKKFFLKKMRKIKIPHKGMRIRCTRSYISNKKARNNGALLQGSMRDDFPFKILYSVETIN